MDISRLEKIYTAYGFEIGERYSNIIVFLYKKGRYFGADIIPLDNNEDTRSESDKIRIKYSDLGYATTLKNINTEHEAEIELFKSFFSYESSQQRLKRKHFEFEKKQTANLLGSTYEYIECPFEIYDNEEESLGFIDHIKHILSDEYRPHLIIIEAAAGYGKTSTAFELLKCIIEDNQSVKLPIITELARNRGANIFRYILLDEIDIEFPTLNSELVIHEITNGRIPLIIDGFDELLDKINLESEISTLEEVEPMLNTISNLLKNKAKVILTTRKTAIFNGLEFDNWLNKYNDSFTVNRISIKEPRILDWLGQERNDLLIETNVLINYIANPVLLTYLRNLNTADFYDSILNSQNLVEQYFNRMLEREMERQNLLITVSSQYEIFKNVTKLLIELDSSTESKEFFKEIIKDQNIKLLESARIHYPEKPTIDSLVDTLATHALLDRKGRDGNQIGFINDFVFGSFIGDIMTETTGDEIFEKFSPYMIELAVTAFKVQNDNKRQDLWLKLNSCKEQFTDYMYFYFDVNLTNGLQKGYSNLTIKEATFYSTRFLQYRVTDTVFISCTFKNCTFDLNLLNGISFIDCIFEKCQVIGDLLFSSNNTITIIKCVEKDCHVINDFEIKNDYQDLNIDDVEVDVLNLIYHVPNHKKHLIGTLLQKIKNHSPKKISIALYGLEKRKLIIIKGSQVEFNINRIAEIKQLCKSENALK